MIFCKKIFVPVGIAIIKQAWRFVRFTYQNGQSWETHYQKNQRWNYSRWCSFLNTRTWYSLVYIILSIGVYRQMIIFSDWLQTQGRLIKICLINKDLRGMIKALQWKKPFGMRLITLRQKILFFCTFFCYTDVAQPLVIVLWNPHKTAMIPFCHYAMNIQAIPWAFQRQFDFTNLQIKTAIATDESNRWKGNLRHNASPWPLHRRSTARWNALVYAIKVRSNITALLMIFR